MTDAKHRNEFLELAARLGMDKPLSHRDEANALTAYAFRNGMIEDLHAGRSSPLLEDSSLSRITDAEMKELMIEASQKLSYLLELRENSPDEYKALVRTYWMMYCQSWER